MNLFKFIIPLFIMTLLANTVNADNRVVAKINGKPLTAFELNEEFQEILPLAGSYHGGVSDEKLAEIRDKALNSLIDKELQYQYAVEKGIAVSKEEVDSEFAKMENRFESSKKFKEAVKKSGITKNELKDYIKKRLLAIKAKEQEVTSKSLLSDTELKEYYEKNRSGYKKPEEFRASHILIGIDPAATKEEREKKLKLAEGVLARVKAGDNFSDLAMRYSSDQGSAPIGGDLGSFHRGMADEAFEQAVLSLKVGEVSGIVETIYGYHIILLTDKKPETQLSFDDVKLEIKKKIEKKKADELYRNWMEGLRTRANIEIIKK